MIKYHIFQWKECSDQSSKLFRQFGTFLSENDFLKQVFCYLQLMINLLGFQ